MANRRGREIEVRPFDPQARPIGELAPVQRPAGEGDTQIATATAQLAHSLGAIADDAARVEGHRAGLAAGADPSYRPTGDTSLRGRAFEAAALRTYGHTLNARLREDVLRIAADHLHNPAGLTPALDALRESYRKDLVPEIAGQFDEMFTRMRLPFDRRALYEIESRQFRAAAAAGRQSLNARRGFAEAVATTVAVDGNDDGGLGAEIDELRRGLDQSVERGEMSRPEASRFLADTASGVISAAVIGAYERLPDADARAVYLQGLDRQIDKIIAPFGDLGDGATDEIRKSLFAQLNDRNNREALAADLPDGAPAAIEAEAVRRFRDGALDPFWAASANDYLDAPARRRVEGMAQPQPQGEPDVALYAELLERATTDTPGLIGDAAEAYRVGRIDREGFNRIHDIASRFQQDVEERPYVIDARSDMAIALKPTPLQAPLHARSALRALDAFDRWLDANPQATRNEIADQSERLTAEYRDRAWRAERSELAVPRFAPIARDGITPESLQAISQRLRAEHDAGTVDDDEMVAQVELLQRWQDVLMRTPKGRR